MLYTVLAASLGSVSFKTMLNFMEERRLRSAAIELVGYLEIARNTASAANNPCVIKIISDNTGEFGPDASQSGNACRSGTVIPTLKLRTLSGSNNLRVRVISATGYPLSFNPEGTTTNGATVLLSTSDVASGGWCVDVQSPLATVRRGWLASGANVCNYAVEQ
ncbi:MAG: GspH/FimT family pseudopilin [Cyanobacteriota bacterium]|nr:GspH/FimT family pseudopilin [Cyanobacteriota bacterium]